jgi:hypothetical protein
MILVGGLVASGGENRHSQSPHSASIAAVADPARPKEAVCAACEKTGLGL